MTDEDTLRDLHFVDAQERLYFAEASLGEEARQFLSSPAGRYLHGRARQVVGEAQDVVLGANPDSWWGRRKIRKAQRQVWAAQHFMMWMAEAIQQGELAGFQLEMYRDDLPPE